MKSREEYSEAKVTTMISGHAHCGNSCPRIEIKSVGKNAYLAFCTLYPSPNGGSRTELTLDTKRKHHPWRRCMMCRKNDVSGKVWAKKYPKCPECKGTSFDEFRRICRACEGCGEKRK